MKRRRDPTSRLVGLNATIYQKVAFKGSIHPTLVQTSAPDGANIGRMGYTPTTWAALAAELPSLGSLGSQRDWDDLSLQPVRPLFGNS